MTWPQLVSAVACCAMVGSTLTGCGRISGGEPKLDIELIRREGVEVADALRVAQRIQAGNLLVAAELGCPPLTGRVQVEVYPGSHLPESAFSGASNHGPSGLIDADSRLHLAVDSDDTPPSIALHELVHLYLCHLDWAAELPVVLEEGLCDLVAAREDGATARALELAHRRLLRHPISLTNVWNDTQEELNARPRDEGVSIYALGRVAVESLGIDALIERSKTEPNSLTPELLRAAIDARVAAAFESDPKDVAADVAIRESSLDLLAQLRDEDTADPAPIRRVGVGLDVKSHVRSTSSEILTLRGDSLVNREGEQLVVAHYDSNDSFLGTTTTLIDSSGEVRDLIRPDAVRLVVVQGRQVPLADLDSVNTETLTPVTITGFPLDPAGAGVWFAAEAAVLSTEHALEVGAYLQTAGQHSSDSYSLRRLLWWVHRANASEPHALTFLRIPSRDDDVTEWGIDSGLIDATTRQSAEREGWIETTARLEAQSDPRDK